MFSSCLGMIGSRQMALSILLFTPSERLVLTHFHKMQWLSGCLFSNIEEKKGLLKIELKHYFISPSPDSQRRLCSGGSTGRHSSGGDALREDVVPSLLAWVFLHFSSH